MNGVNRVLGITRTHVRHVHNVKCTRTHTNKGITHIHTNKNTHTNKDKIHTHTYTAQQLVARVVMIRV